MEQDDLLKQLESQIERLQHLGKQDGIDLTDEIERLNKKLDEAKTERQQHLNDWDRVKLARHPNRPTSSSYISYLLDDFYPLHGDRLLGDDRALLGGLGKFDGRTVVTIAQEKGAEAEESKDCNFGMVQPEGYRKAQRLMDLADRFGFPLLTLIDTPGAYPGKESEERNIGGTIASCISRMLKLEVPTIAAIIGEGGSGGALAIGVGDRVLMLQNAIYSVISPEGCAAILWKDQDKADQAASALKLTAPHIAELGLVDEIVEEGDGGAHEDFETTANNLKRALTSNLAELSEADGKELRKSRRDRFRHIGRYRELKSS